MYPLTHFFVCYHVSFKTYLEFTFLNVFSLFNLFIFLFWNGQELEVEYVEGYDELEEEEDMEDFGGFAAHKSQGNYDVG